MSAPRVSVLVPAFNVERWIESALRSVLRQTMSDFELVVVDDASTDGTRDVIARLSDPRLRIYCNPANLGQCGNWDRAVALSRAPVLKFLCGDDLLREDCLERMLSVIDRSPSIGLVFCRREVVAADSRGAAAWAERYAELHRRFGPLAEVNDGRRLFETYMATGFDDNWIGEPTNAMMRREAYLRLGGFNPAIRQTPDMDLWIRALACYDVGFVDEPLATYRRTSGSVTQTTAADGSRWLDKLWTYESLVEDPVIAARYPALRRALWRQRARAAARLLRGPLRRTVLATRASQARAYLRHLARRSRARGGPLEGSPPQPDG
jgi:glycosyltransferase involved in cell wall biosynthesis